MAGAAHLVTLFPEYFFAVPIRAAGRIVTNREVSLEAVLSCQSWEAVALEVLFLVCAVSSAPARAAVAVVFFFAKGATEGQGAVASD